jgi:spore coat protein U-like protein
MRPVIAVMLRVLYGAIAVLMCAVRADAASCTVSTSSIAFGTYDVFSAAPTDTTGSVTFNCTGVGQGSISISLSKGSSLTFDPRTMTGPTPADTLSYNLYRDAAHSTIWGDNTGTTSWYTTSSVQNNTSVTVTIYGRIPAGQDVRTGSYSDAVTATINY